MQQAHSVAAAERQEDRDADASCIARRWSRARRARPRRDRLWTGPRDDRSRYAGLVSGLGRGHGSSDDHVHVVDERPGDEREGHTGTELRGADQRDVRGGRRADPCDRRIDRRHERLAPGSATIRAASGPTASSFTWVGQNPAEHQHTFRLQWRLPSVGSATMSAGDVSLLYQGAPTPSTC